MDYALAQRHYAMRREVRWRQYAMRTTIYQFVKIGYFFFILNTFDRV